MSPALPRSACGESFISEGVPHHLVHLAPTVHSAPETSPCMDAEVIDEAIHAVLLATIPKWTYMNAPSQYSLLIMDTINAEAQAESQVLILNEEIMAVC